MNELFLVSLLFWLGFLLLFFWLDRRLARAARQLEELERQDGGEPGP